MPTVLPSVKREIQINAKVQSRFFLNYCTFGYSMVWWKWRDWERFIDWMALNGINMPLAITGQEAIWYNVWKKFGLTDTEIRAYFTGPAHLPWHRMLNIDYWQGDLPMLFSATMPKTIVDLSKSILYKPSKVEVTPVSSVVDTIQQGLYYVEKEQKTDLLIDLLKKNSGKSILVFSRTKHKADKIARLLNKASIACEAIHGNKTQTARQRALTNFKSGKIHGIHQNRKARNGVSI